MLYTTFKLLREHRACSSDYNKLAGLKGGVNEYGDNTPIPLDEIVKTLGLADGLWALQALTEPTPSWVWLMGAEFAERVLSIFARKYPEDERPRKAIEAIRDFTAGQISRAELMKAAYAAHDAAYAAHAAASDAAHAAHADYAARGAERKWQIKRFLELLQGVK